MSYKVLQLFTSLTSSATLLLALFPALWPFHYSPNTPVLLFKYSALYLILPLPGVLFPFKSLWLSFLILFSQLGSEAFLGHPI